MASLSLVKDLLNSRARIFHVPSQTYLSGWIYDLRLPNLWLMTQQNLREDGPLCVSAQSHQTAILFNVEVVGADIKEMQQRQAPIFLEGGVTLPNPSQRCYQLRIVSEIRRNDNAQATRKVVVGFAGRIRFDGGEMPASVFDVSAEGVGLLLTNPLSSGLRLSLSCSVGEQTVDLDGVVCHCRRIAAAKPLFLCGVRFDALSRVDAARWKMRLEEAHNTPSRHAGSGEGGAEELTLEMESEMAPILDPESEKELADGLKERASNLLMRLQRVSQTERRLMLRQVKRSAADGQDGIDEALLAIDKKLERLRRYEMNLEQSLFKTLEILNLEGHRQERGLAA